MYDMEGRVSQWERTRDGWVERVFWGKLEQERVLWRNNLGATAQ
jgi:hypothetical protein